MNKKINVLQLCECLDHGERESVEVVWIEENKMQADRI